jgi:hypothetical protein
MFIFRGNDQFYRNAVNIKNGSNKQMHTFCKILLLNKGPLGFLYISFIDLSTCRKIEQTPHRWATLFNFFTHSR